MQVLSKKLLTGCLKKKKYVLMFCSTVLTLFLAWLAEEGNQQNQLLDLLNHCEIFFS